MDAIRQALLNSLTLEELDELRRQKVASMKRPQPQELSKDEIKIRRYMEELKQDFEKRKKRQR